MGIAITVAIGGFAHWIVSNGASQPAGVVMVVAAAVALIAVAFP